MSMQVIQHIEVPAGGTSSINFTSIPQTYTDLLIVASVRNSSTFEHLLIGINGSTANFSERYFSGYGSNGISNSTYPRYLGNTTRAGQTANTFGSTSIYIPNYTSSSNKSIMAESLSENNNATDFGAVMSGNLWSQTTAISSIQITNEGAATILEYSSATLYGITKGTDGITVVS